MTVVETLSKLSSALGYIDTELEKVCLRQGKGIFKSVSLLSKRLPYHVIYELSSRAHRSLRIDSLHSQLQLYKTRHSSVVLFILNTLTFYSN